MDGCSGSDGHRRLWRSRWAAIGAAVAVTLGGGGIFAVQAASSPASSVVTIDPVRVLDTRNDVGLAGPFVSAVSQKLQVTGGAVPAGATGVLLNVTVVSPTAAGFVSIRPGDATGVASTSSLNFDAEAVVPNAVQVGLPTAGVNAGQVDITYDAYGTAGPSTEMLIDIVGYMIPGDDRYYTKTQVDAVAGPVRRTMSFPAQSMNYRPGGAISQDAEGLSYSLSNGSGATLAIGRPADFAGTGDVTLTVTFFRTTAAIGQVRFFAYARDLQIGQTEFADQANYSSTTEGAAGIWAFRQSTISWPAAGEEGPIWNITLFRDTTPTAPYPDSVVVASVSLSYDATR